MGTAVSHLRGTATSSFGVGRREGHDASAFYNRFPAPEVRHDDDVAEPACRDRLWVGDARAMDTCGQVADRSVALVVTSPPYFAGKEYEEAMGQGHIPAGYVAYLEMLHDVFAQCVNKLEPGGRIAVNVANLGRRPYRSLSADVIHILQDRLGLLLRGEVIWRKAQGAGGNCAWGSFLKPGNPVLRDLTERVVIASKGRFDRAIPPARRAAEDRPYVGTAQVDEFMEATTDLWDIPPESATRVGHPAPFPVELPQRLIELYTYQDDLVLDPFIGAGTAAVAAVRTGRHYVGFDTDADYIDLAEQRIKSERERLAEERIKSERERLTIPEGPKALEKAREVLEASGFRQIREKVLYPCGAEVNFAALDQHGNKWLFDVSGAFSVTQRPGLRRTDTLWKAIGKAAVLHTYGTSQGKREPLVLLTTSRPAPNSAGHRALAAVTGPGKPIHDVVEMLDSDDVERLADFARGLHPNAQPQDSTNPS